MPIPKPAARAALYLFGSYARDEAGPDSDVDVFVDKALGRRFGLSELMGSHRALQEALHRGRFRDARGIVRIY